MNQSLRAFTLVIFSDHPLNKIHASLLSFLSFLGSAAVHSHSDPPPSAPCRNTLVQEFLQKSCGLSRKQAMLASKPLTHLKSTENMQQALQFFKEHGFDSVQIRNLVSREPRVLASSLSKTLQPKLQVFEDLRMAKTEVARVISKRPSILTASIQKKLLPAISFLRSMVVTDENLVKILTREPWILTGCFEKKLKPNLLYLQAIGMDQNLLWTLWLRKPRFLMSPETLIRDVLDTVDRLGVPRHSRMFPHAVAVVSSMAKGTLERKRACLMSLGLSEEEVWMAFRRLPYIFAASEKRLQGHMDFLVNTLKYEASAILSYPQFITSSLESKILPRYRVLQALGSMQLPKERFSVIDMLSTSEKVFLKKFVFKYGESSGLYEIYKGTDGIVFSPNLGVREGKCEEVGLQ